LDSSEKEARLPLNNYHALVAEAKALFVRVKTESNDAELIMTALLMEAACASILGNPNEVIELLEKTAKPAYSHEILLASAYSTTERHKEAESVLQIGLHEYNDIEHTKKTRRPLPR